LPAGARQQGRGEDEHRHGQVGRAPVVPRQQEQRMQPVERPQPVQPVQWVSRAHATTIDAARRSDIDAAA
jgi:hypothetical protein